MATKKPSTKETLSAMTKEAVSLGIYDKDEQTKNDIAALNKLSVPVTELRLYLAGLTVAGVTEIPLGSLWVEVRRIVREKDAG